MEPKGYQNGLNILEELTRNAHQIQEQVLWEILMKNAGTEYLRRFLHGQADKQLFKNNVPIVTYEDIKPYIDRIDNGEASAILLADPITQFVQSTGTSGGQPKLIPMTAESLEKRVFDPILVDLLMKKYFDGLDEGKSMYLYFVKPEMKTPSGLTAAMYTTIYFKSNSFKNGLAKSYTSPIETIFCLDNKQSMFCQLLAGLLRRDEVVRIGLSFASTLAKSIKFLEDYSKELCSNIRTGYLSDWITDSGCKYAMSSILTRPNPDLAETIEQIFDDKSWEGIIKKLWPKAKCISCITTGRMSQYISLLDFYGDGIHLASPSYGSSEAAFGTNIKPLSKPSDVSYTCLPNMAYFEFIPLNRDSEEKAQEFDSDGASSKEPSEMRNKKGNVEPVDLANVKLGQCYEVVVTTLTGLYRYRVGDILKAITNAILSLDALGCVLTSYSSYADTSSTPGRYVLFWELKMKASNDFPKLDAKIMEKCCCVLEESFDFTYKSLRKVNTIAPLELRVVKHGTFDALMDFYVSKGASISQYKVPCCIKSEEAIKILNSVVEAKFFNPKTIF
ncbi:hypothetical protein PTKIN_Ptkin11bG0139900 [Pterospermum kingtungense]